MGCRPWRVRLVPSNPAELLLSPRVAIRPDLVSSVRIYLSMPAFGVHHPQMWGALRSRRYLGVLGRQGSLL